MIIDTSALLAVLFDEDDAERFRNSSSGDTILIFAGSFYRLRCRH